ncbi:hypothetical protein TNCV_316151 [Trichonephila clavipes]|nr:hypothetical protein TNCV_316151 [Trichonephila clavipes]
MVIRHYPEKLEEFIGSDIKFCLPVSKPFINQDFELQGFLGPCRVVSKIWSSAIILQSYEYFGEPARKSDSKPRNTSGIYFSCTFVNKHRFQRNTCFATFCQFSSFPDS